MFHVTHKQAYRLLVVFPKTNDVLIKTKEPVRVLGEREIIHEELSAEVLNFVKI